MLRGLWRLTWLETRIFLREPMGVVGAVGVPVLLSLALGGLVSAGLRRAPRAGPRFAAADVPVAAAMLVATSAVLSLVTIIAIYRDSGILKRLRATPLRPHTILLAHVMVKLLLTTVSVAVMIVAGRRYFPIPFGVPLLSFALAAFVSTMSILSLGFVIASVVPTARFAPPMGAFVLYPMLALSGLFMPVGVLPPVLRAVSAGLPLTWAVSLMRGVLQGDGWIAHLQDLSALALFSVVCTVVSARVFRWE
jgi:ABC-2 type transport system permease protein